MKKLITLMLVFVVVGCLQFNVSAQAAEITPAPNSYTYGSTSELSPGEAIQPGSESTTQLVNTGTSTSLSKIVIAATSVGSLVLVVVAWRMSTRLRLKYKLQR